MPGNHQVKPLPFAYNALDGISEQTNKYHHDTHYAGYVNKRNEVENNLEKVDRSKAHANWSDFGELKRRETFNAAGMVNHEIYWDILGGKGKPEGSLIDKIKADFGSFEAWMEDFKASAKTALGWTVLAFDFVDGRLHNFNGDSHDLGVWNTVPLVPIDVFEHAYYHDQGPNRANYIEAYLRNIDWKKVSTRFEKWVPKNYKTSAQASHLVKPLPYAYNALDGISEQTNKYHHDTHYAGYVNKRNEIEKTLSGVDKSKAHANWSDFGELKRREVFNACGQILHEIYWDALGGKGKPEGSVIEKINSDFGSFQAWETDFKAAAKCALGWTILVFDPSDNRLHNFNGDSHHMGVIWGSTPLLPIDVFEHAYYHDQGPNRAAYIDAFLRNVDWKKVSARYEKRLKP